MQAAGSPAPEPRAMVSAEVWAGVNALLDDYLELTPQDVLLLAYAPDSYEVAAWVSAAVVLKGMQVRRVPMLPLVDAGFLERLAQAVPSPKEVRGRLIILTFELDTMSHDQEIRQAISAFP